MWTFFNIRTITLGGLIRMANTKSSSVTLIRGETELNTLIEASEARKVASEAIAIHEQESIARLINNAVNTGNYSCRLNKPLSATMKATLEGMGYIITQEPGADSRLGWIISW